MGKASFPFPILIIYVWLAAVSPLLAFARPIVTDISAELGSNKTIVLSWTMPDATIDTVLVFRASVPITSFEQVRNIAPKATLGDKQSFYVDKSPLKAECYYAVVLVTNGQRFPVIIPSVNSTVVGIIPASPHRRPSALPSEKEMPLIPSGTSRSAPLPYEEERDGYIADGTREKAGRLALQGINAQRDRELEVYIFKEDLTVPTGGDDVFLFDILKTSFINQRYDEAADAIEHILGTNLSHSVLLRSQFYLGECRYYTFRYDEAITAFLKAQEMAYSENGELSPDISSLCSIWIDSSLDLSSTPSEVERIGDGS